MVARAHSAANCSCSGRGAHWGDPLPARHAASLCQALLPATDAAAPRRGRRGAARVAVQATSLEGPPTWMTGLELPQYDRAAGTVELVVAGAGPSGLAVADRVSQAGTPLCRALRPCCCACLCYRSYRLVSTVQFCLL